MTHPKPKITKLLSRGAIATALAIAGVLGGSAAYAAMVPEVTAEGSVKAGQLSVAVTNFSNQLMRMSDDSIAMPFTITNTTTTASTQKAKTSIRLSSTGQIYSMSWVWPVANASACPVNAPIANDAIFVGWPLNATVTTDLARGESQTYCFRTMRSANLGVSSGSVSSTITVAATLSLGNFQVTNQSSATLSTRSIYPTVSPVDNWYTLQPQNQSWCLDVTGGVNAVAGAIVGTYTCHNSTDVAYGNQWFSFKPVTNGHAIRPKGPAGTSLQPSGSSVVVRATNATLKDQTWIIQQSSPTSYQIVNLASGLCVTAPASYGQLTLALCNDLATQKFVYARVNVAIPTMADLEDSVSSIETPSETTPETPEENDTELPEANVGVNEGELTDVEESNAEGREPSELMPAILGE